LANDFTVQITQTYDDDDDFENVVNFRTTGVKDGKFKVIGINGKFFWQVFAKRLTIDVEQNKDQVNVKGNGPYRWI